MRVIPLDASASRSVQTGRRSFRWVLLGGLATVFALFLWTASVGSGAGQLSATVALWPGVAAAVIAGYLVSRKRPFAIPGLVAATPLLVLAVTSSSPFGDGPLGIDAASGALYVIAGAGALRVARGTGHRGVRSALYVLAGAWLLAAFATGTNAAALGAIATMVATVAITRGSQVRAVSAAAGAIVMLAVAITVLLGVTEAPSGSPDLVDRIGDETVGEHRVWAWGEAVGRIRHEPLTGVGPARPGDAEAADGHASGHTATNSSVLGVAAESGVIAGSLFVGVLVWPFVAIRRRRLGPETIFAVLAAGVVAVTSVIDDLWSSPVVPLAMAALLGAALADPPDGNAPHPGAAPGAPGDARRLAWTSALFGVLLLAPVTPSNAPFTVPNDVRWLDEDAGIELGGRGGVFSSTAERLSARLVEAGELSVELTVAPSALDQSGPARIISISSDTTHRNLTIGQDLDALVVRLRTTETNVNASEPSTSVPGVFTSTMPVHVIVTSDLRETRVSVDGVLRHRGPGPGGDFRVWNLDHPLVLGNEATGDRPWAGRISHVAFYDRVLDRTEIARRHDAHVNGIDTSATAASTSSTSASSASIPPSIARYPFDEASGRTVHDRSADRVGGPLTIPSRFPSGPAGPTWTIDDVTGYEWAGIVAHAIAIVGWLAIAYALVRGRAGKAVGRWILGCLLVLTLCAAIVTFAVWPRDDVPRDPDAVIVLGGAGLERAQLGTALRDRYDAELVLSSSAVEAGRRLGLACGRDVTCIDPVPETTAGEASTVAALADERGWRRMVIATSRFHTTRARVLFRQCLGSRVDVVGTPPPDGRPLGDHLDEVVGTLAGLTVRRAC